MTVFSATMVMPFSPMLPEGSLVLSCLIPDPRGLLVSSPALPVVLRHISKGLLDTSWSLCSNHTDLT